MEAELDDDSRSRHVTGAEVGMSVLLACVCRLIEFGWVGIPDAAFLVLAVGALAFRAHRRHGYGPFMLGLCACCGSAGC